MPRDGTTKINCRHDTRLASSHGERAGWRKLYRAPRWREKNVLDIPFYRSGHNASYAETVHQTQCNSRDLRSALRARPTLEDSYLSVTGWDTFSRRVGCGDGKNGPAPGPPYFVCRSREGEIACWNALGRVTGCHFSCRLGPGRAGWDERARRDVLLLFAIELA